MNTSQVEQALIQAGFTFSKTHDKVSEKNMWLCCDGKNLVGSSHFRGELVKSVAKNLGGV